MYVELNYYYIDCQNVLVYRLNGKFDKTKPAKLLQRLHMICLPVNK